MNDPDVIMRMPEDWPEAGPFVGRDAVTRQLERQREMWDADAFELISDFVDVAITFSSDTSGGAQAYASQIGPPRSAGTLSRSSGRQREGVAGAQSLVECFHEAKRGLVPDCPQGRGCTYGAGLIPNPATATAKRGVAIAYRVEESCSLGELTPS